VHELAHHRPEAVAEFAEAAKIPYVLISHIAPDMTKPRKNSEKFRKRYNGQLIVAMDGTTVRLDHLRTDGMIEPEPYLSDPILPDPAQAFLDELQHNLFLPPDLSRQILSAAQTTLLQPTTAQKSGTTHISVAGTRKSGGEHVDVTVTLDAGPADIEYKQAHGTAALRRHRLARIYQEVAAQGGALTQEEFARLLNVSVRTIRRDILSLRKDGFAVQTIGQ
jgi:hypothetical protein